MIGGDCVARTRWRDRVLTDRFRNRLRFGRNPLATIGLLATAAGLVIIGFGITREPSAVECGSGACI